MTHILEKLDQRNVSVAGFADAVLLTGMSTTIAAGETRKQNCDSARDLPNHDAGMRLSWCSFFR